MNPYQYITNVEKKENTEAQRALQKALIDLNQQKEIHVISVKDLCSQAHVARSTFYSYYDNVMQLKEEIEDNLLYQLLEVNKDFGKTEIDFETGFPFFQNTCRLIEQNKQAFYAFLIANPNIPFIQKWQTGIKYHFWNQLFHGKSIKNENMILEMISTLSISAFVYWLKNPYDVDIDSMNHLIIKSFEIFK